MVNRINSEPNTEALSVKPQDDTVTDMVKTENSSVTSDNEVFNIRTKDNLSEPSNRIFTSQESELQSESTNYVDAKVNSQNEIVPVTRKSSQSRKDTIINPTKEHAAKSVTKTWLPPPRTKVKPGGSKQVGVVPRARAV